MTQQQLYTVCVAVIIGIVVGVVLAHVLMQKKEFTQEERIAEFYATETAVLVSPHGLRKKILEGNNEAVLVDVRSQEEYEREHIVGALSVPAYKDPRTSAYGDVERIVQSFRDIQKEYPSSDIIVYCYSTPCMTGRKVGHMLAEHDLYVKELGVGWNEWRYDWNSWNHEHEWEDTNAQQYVSSGSEPGVFELPEGTAPQPCAIENEFGC